MKLFDDIYRNRPVFVTGHTGFKGSWLCGFLNVCGAKITGYALPPETTPSHFSLLKPNLIADYRDDIRHADKLTQAVQAANPEIVFHLAAQPLVRRSYRYPAGTFSTNILGTVHLLEACRQTASVRAVVVVTTDKCYKNQEWDWGYRENDSLGGHDPYSASKACAELVAESYRQSFSEMSGRKILYATCRAGNVIGGGDWSEDRLIPDLIRDASNDTVTKIRMPQATRPWQHVLDPLAAYLLVGKRLLDGDVAGAEAWNFGPDTDGNLSVEQIAKKSRAVWDKIKFDCAEGTTLHETQLLMLDCTKAKRRLQWKPVWKIDEAVTKTIEWYKTYYETGRLLTQEQIADWAYRACDADPELTCFEQG